MAEAEEIAQAVLDGVRRRMEDHGLALNGVDDLRAYLYTCARNGALDVLRKRARGGDPVAPEPEYPTMFLHECERLVARTSVGQELKIEKYIIELAKRPGGRYGALAGELDVSANSIAQKKRRLFRRLKAQMLREDAAHLASRELDEGCAKTCSEFGTFWGDLDPAQRTFLEGFMEAKDLRKYMRQVAGAAASRRARDLAIAMLDALIRDARLPGEVREILLGLAEDRGIRRAELRGAEGCAADGRH